MTVSSKSLPIAFCIITFASFSMISAQTNSRTTTQTQTNQIPQNVPTNSIEFLANEIGLLRKSLQTLNKRLSETTQKTASDAKTTTELDLIQKRILLNLDILSRAEQRAEVLRKQLFELIEKETTLKSRGVQIEEDMNPINIERNSSLVGSTRTVEMRDVRRKSLENERKGVNDLLSQIAQSRSRLEDDVRQADALVYRLRQKVIPAIEKALE